MQFNAARIDSLPVEAHDRGWAVYPSGMKLPISFNFGALRRSKQKGLGDLRRLALWRYFFLCFFGSLIFGGGLEIFYMINKSK